MDPVARSIVEAVELNAKLLDDVQAAIWRTPEVRFEERKAHDLLTEELHKAGFRVTPSYILPTGFRAEYGTGGPCVCFVAEYDALPEAGHACGHNLIAEAALGASLALKKALDNAPGLSGRVVCLGTPAEEGGSGKELMLRGGALKDVDAVVMVHPSAVNDAAPPFMAVAKVRVRYTGRASYVVGAPACAVNALDAAVTAYTSAAAMRQHMRPSWKVRTQRECYKPSWRGTLCRHRHVVRLNRQITF
ncbi:hypothetical protein V5799_015735 [Amblyomma americanum]|uniref:Peptidase M20 domain-containing protein 2 n=1 Tax=Amblyomma americanum TaxID=6943 RepID=A0AAQ4F701_AMBAM